MRLRHTCLWLLASSTALGAWGCGGDEKSKDDPVCDGGTCDEGDSGRDRDGSVVDEDGEVVPDECSDGKQDGDEVDVDCGGDCDPCGENAACEENSDCESAVCIANICAHDSCDDQTENGQETGIDCGGTCDACPGQAVCEDAETCGPEASFTLSDGGAAPITVTATSTAKQGAAMIVQTRYDWGDGTGSGTSRTHEYLSGGSYTVVQTVIDEEGRVGTATQSIVITGFTPVRMSSAAADQSTGLSQQGASVPNVFLLDDGLTIEVAGMDEASVRSDTAIPSGGNAVYYFEGERLFPGTADFWGFGVATADQPMSPATVPTNPPGNFQQFAWLGSTAQSFGVFTQGSVTTDFYKCVGKLDPVSVSNAREEGAEHFGFVVDYRAAHPTIYLIAKDGTGTPAVQCQTTLAMVSKPLYILYTGRRAKVGPQGRVNTGADTVNHPFFYTPDQVSAALTDAGAAAVVPAVTYGYARTRALPASEAPVLDAPATASVRLGRAVTLTATATDAEDGAITDKIEWVDRASSYSRGVHGYGGTFTYTPVGIGDHQVEVSVTDSVGIRTTRTVVLSVTGTLESFPTVRFLDDPGHGERATIAANGVSVYFGPTGFFKDAVRVNQGLKGDFWYFEATRPPIPAGEMIKSMGIGLVVGDAALNPYSIYDVPWSMSVNISAGVWRNLINIGNLSAGSAMPGNEAGFAPTVDRYGFAVDYRGEHPIVYVLVGTGATARYIATINHDEIDVPVYPFVYSGDGEDGSADRPAITLNFGTPAFTNVKAALAAPGDPGNLDPVAAPDIAALKLGWGAAAR